MVSKVILKNWMLRTTSIAFLICVLTAIAPVTADEGVWSQTSSNGLFEVTLDPQTDDAVQINQFLAWIVTIKTTDGEVVTPARVTVSGGMPMHGHGLPSQPQVSEYLGEGKYLLKGLMFSMKGRWSINLDIQSQSSRDRVSFEIKLDY